MRAVLRGTRAREGSPQERFSSQLVTSWSSLSHGLPSQILEAELLPVFSEDGEEWAQLG